MHDVSGEPVGQGGSCRGGDGGLDESPTRHRRAAGAAAAAWSTRVAATKLFTVLCVGSIAFLQARGALGQTEVPAGELGETTWTQAGSPYLVTGDLSFDTLRIEAGTSVLVATADPPIILRTSVLEVNGDPDRPVIIEAETPDDDFAWRSIIAQTATVRYAEMRHASTALIVSSEGFVFASLFENNSFAGLEVYGEARVDRSVFRSNGNGVFYTGARGSTGSRGLVVENSLFVAMGLDGVACNGLECTIVNSTFDNNEFGIYAGGREVSARNDIFSNNRYAIDSTLELVEVWHSNFWQNGRDLFDDDAATLVEGNIFVDPEYASAASYRLSATSPCIDSGGAEDAPDHDLGGSQRPIEGDGYPDDDGSNYDMGAYEYDPDAPDGPSQPGAGGEGGQAGERGDVGAVGSGGGSGNGGSVADGVGASSSGGLKGATSGGDGGASTGGQITGDDDAGAQGGGTVRDGEPSRATSRGCDCRQAGAGRSASPPWLLLFLVGAARRTRRWHANNAPGQ